MAIDYNWVCNSCGATNLANTEICHACTRPALGPSSHLSGRERLLVALILVPVVSATALMWIFNPPDVAWWVGAAVNALGLTLIGVLKLRERAK